MNLAKMQIPRTNSFEAQSDFYYVLFRDNRGLRFSVRSTSVDALFYFRGKKIITNTVDFFQNRCYNKCAKQNLIT